MARVAKMIPSFGGERPGRNVAPSSSRPPHSSLGGKGLPGFGAKTGLGGKGLGKGGLKRHKYVKRRPKLSSFSCDLSLAGPQGLQSEKVKVEADSTPRLGRSREILSER